MSERGRILVLWNQVEEDIYERWREEGPKKLAWDPTRTVPDVGTVAEEMAGFLQALRDGGFHVDIVNVLDDLERVIGACRLYKPDAIFNLIEYFNDDQVQEAYVAGLFDMLGIPYTGNPPTTLLNCQNKYRTKLLLEGEGLPTSPYFVCRKEPVPTDHELAFPLIVKPALEDASGGIEHSSVVQDQAGLEERVRHVHKEYEMPALVEEYIEGREIHAAVLGNSPPEVLPLFEMEFDDTEFNPEGEWRPQIISFRAKWDPHSKDFYSMDSVCPPEDLDPELEERIQEVALGAYKAMGCRDYARIDMRVDEDEGEIYILEINPNPDLIEGTAYIQCATASGRSYSEILCEIAQMPIDRARIAREKWDRARAEGKAGLPSDQLLKEFVMDKQPVPASGGGGAKAAPVAEPAKEAGDGPAEDDSPAEAP
jgi:D-alanine-D-alanine ligase